MKDNSMDCATDWDCRWIKNHAGETCPLHDSRPDKSGTEFTGALKEATSLFRLTVPKTYSLRGVIFPKSFDGNLYDLLGGGEYELHLQSSKFCGLVNFDGRKFLEAVDFNGAAFAEAASFQHVRFSKGASFCDAAFQRDAIFAESMFEDLACFDQMQCERADFALAQFKSMASFRGKPDQVIFDRVKEVIFDEARFFKPDLVRLSYADFSRCSLLNTDLRGIDFSGVRWGEKGRWEKHVVLYSRNPEREVRIELESAYRQIRQSYEDRRDYGRAGAFYFGEMDQKWKRGGGFLVTLYRWSSSYGLIQHRHLSFCFSC